MEGVYYFANGANVYQIKAAPGVLKRVIVGTAEANGTLTFYDNASANANEMMALLGSSVGSHDIFARMQNGIRLVAANATKVTVIYE